jgi:hypothetical protein
MIKKLMCLHFQFTIEPDVVPEIKDVSVIDTIHHTCGPGIQNDADFVRTLMKLIFTAEELGTHSLKGSRSTDSGTKVMTILRFDPQKIDYVYKQYCIRVRSAGINDEDRKKRAELSVFQHYMSMLTNNEHTKWNAKLKKMNQQ